MKERKTKLFTTSSVILIIVSIFILCSTDTILSINESYKSKTISNTNTTNENIVEAEVESYTDTKQASQEVSLDGFLFLGDSFTVLLQETIEKNNPDAVVLGQVGVQPGYWNENFSVLPDSRDINGVVLLIGVNGVTFDDNLPNKKELLDSLVEKYKDKTIYVEKVFPVGKNFTNANPDTFNEAIKAHNKEMQSYCEQYDNVIFIDATEGLVTEDGYLKYTKDGLHITSDKQEVFYSNIEKAIKEVN